MNIGFFFLFQGKQIVLVALSRILMFSILCIFMPLLSGNPAGRPGEYWLAACPLSPCVVVALVARADLDLPVALLALDEAAPVELALAALHPLLPPRRVPAVAAHQLAPVDSRAPLQQKGKKSCISACSVAHFSSLCQSLEGEFVT